MAVTVAELEADVLLRNPLLRAVNPEGYATTAGPPWPVMAESLRKAIGIVGGTVAADDAVTDADLATALTTPEDRSKFLAVFEVLVFSDATGAFVAVDVSVGGTGSNRRIDQLRPRLLDAVHIKEAILYRGWGLIVTGGTGGGVIPAGAAAMSQAIRGGRFDPAAIPIGGVVPGLPTPGLAYPGANPRTGRRYPWPNGYGW
jgi:hypothetical protein